MNMGCLQSTERKLYNGGDDIKRKFMIGVHFSKGGDGMEGNFQVAKRSTKKLGGKPLSLGNLSKRKNDLNF